MFTREDKQRAVIAGIIISVVLIIWATYSAFTYRKTTPVMIVETNWQLEVGLLQYQPIEESNWDYAPQGAYNIREEYEYRRSDRYIKGYDEDGDAEYGYRSIYDYKYYYTMDRWVNIPPLVTSGTSKETVEWPDTTGYVKEASDVIGNVKLGLPLSHFWVVAKTDKGKLYSVDMDENKWRGYYNGKKAKLTLGFFGNVLGLN